MEQLNQIVSTAAVCAGIDRLVFIMFDWPVDGHLMGWWCGLCLSGYLPSTKFIFNFFFFSCFLCFESKPSHHGLTSEHGGIISHQVFWSFNLYVLLYFSSKIDTILNFYEKLRKKLILLTEHFICFVWSILSSYISIAHDCNIDNQRLPFISHTLIEVCNRPLSNVLWMNWI